MAFVVNKNNSVKAINIAARPYFGLINIKGCVSA
jgi:hypothetical protein